MTDATRTPTTALAGVMHSRGSGYPPDGSKYPNSTTRSWWEEEAVAVAAELARQGVILVDREALAAALRDGKWVQGVADRYGTFNDAYWKQRAAADPAALIAAIEAMPYPELREAAMIYSCQKCGTQAPDERLLLHTTSDQYRTGKCFRCKRKRVFLLEQGEAGTAGRPASSVDPAGPRDVREGRMRAERGMRRAEAAEGRASDWNIAADSVIRELAESGIEFTSEDVTARVGLPTRSPGAVGARMNAAGKRGWIAWTGRMRQAERPNQHAAVLKVWKGVGW